MLTDRHALKTLQQVKHQIDCQEHPNVPPAYIPLCKFALTKTNDIERAIVLWFKLHGYKAERVKVQGRKVGSDVVYHNPITGKVQVIDKAKYIPSSGAKGSADISATCRDKTGGVMSLRIEVKNTYTNDRVRPDQLKYKEEHERSGGTYIVVRTFGELMEWTATHVHGVDISQPKQV